MEEEEEENVCMSYMLIPLQQHTLFLNLVGAAAAAAAAAAALPCLFGLLL